jgi:hypothetical protein
MIDELRNNVNNEIQILENANRIDNQLGGGGQADPKIANAMIDSSKKRIKMLNDTTPALVSNVTLAKKLPSATDALMSQTMGNVAANKESAPGTLTNLQAEEGSATKIQVIDASGTGITMGGIGNVALRKEFVDDYLKQLNINRELVKKLKKKKIVVEKQMEYFKKPSAYGTLANKYFLKYTDNLIASGKFKKLSLDLRKSNLGILTATYISMMLLTTFISLFVGLFLFVVLIFIDFNFTWPMITLRSGITIVKVLQISWVLVGVPLATWVALYVYPGAEKSALSRRINQEIPFMVIHMGSISGSGIDPLKIFKIVGLSDEYQYSGKEIRKILNQTNVYGYDLTNALRNVSRATPSLKLSELLNGMSTVISSGGDIKRFFEKRSESLLLSYKLEREKFTKTAETFMDIYISIVIATPMLLLLLLILISVTGIQIGFGVTQLTAGIIGLVAIINIAFITFLHIKQPSY